MELGWVKESKQGGEKSEVKELMIGPDSKGLLLRALAFMLKKQLLEILS